MRSQRAKLRFCTHGFLFFHRASKFQNGPILHHSVSSTCLNCNHRARCYVRPELNRRTTLGAQSKCLTLDTSCSVTMEKSVKPGRRKGAIIFLNGLYRVHLNLMRTVKALIRKREFYCRVCSQPWFNWYLVSISREKVPTLLFKNCFYSHKLRHI